MRVLMVNDAVSLRLRGGDRTQMRKAAEALQPLGVEVSESFETKPDATAFDLAHVFNLRNLPNVLLQVRHLKEAGVPVVMSPIYLNPSLALWGTRVINHIFRVPRPPGELDRLLSKFRSRELKIDTEGGDQWTAHKENRDRPHYGRYSGKP